MVVARDGEVLVDILDVEFMGCLVNHKLVVLLEALVVFRQVVVYVG